MKRIYFSILFILFFNLSKAQIPAAIINQEDIATVGYEVFQIKDTLPIASIAKQILNNTGADQKWDFSLLNPHVTDTIQFIDPSQTFYSNQFPDANVCALKVEKGKDYFIQNAKDGLYFVGNASNALEEASDIVIYNPPMQVIRYPFSYLDTLYSSALTEEIIYWGKYLASGTDSNWVDSIKTLTTTEFSSIVDAYGNVTTPNNLYNAIRQNASRFIRKDIFTFSIGQDWIYYETKYDSSYYLKWWAENAAFPVAECNYNPHSSEISNIKYSSFRQMDTTSIVHSIDKATNFLLFPNPATESIYLSNVSTNCNHIRVYDYMGNIVIDRELNVSDSSTIINIKHLSSGIYYCFLFNNQNQCLSHSKFTKTH